MTWSPILIYFGITIILGLLDWTGLARAVRSKLLAVREEDFVSAAVLMGARPKRVIRAIKLREERISNILNHPSIEALNRLSHDLIMLR